MNKNTPIKPFAFTPENYGVYFSEDGNQYVTNSKSVGQVTITAADTISRVISGTFSFQCANVKNSSQTVEVSKGRFDINMKTLN